MFRNALAACASWRARSLDVRAATTADSRTRANLRDRALIWGYREHLLLGLLSWQSYGRCVRVLKRAIAYRNRMCRSFRLATQKAPPPPRRQDQAEAGSP